MRRAPSHLEERLVLALKARGLPLPVREHRFAPPRRWRFDLAWPDLMVAVEVDGGQWVQGSHQRGWRVASDAEKRNAAAVAGWLVLTYTTEQVMSGAAASEVERVVRQRKEEVERMAHVRYLHPEMFLDERLAAVPPLARLLWLGLQTQADREGRLEWRPARLKALLLPYDREPVEPLVEALRRAGLVHVYEAGGGRYLALTTWREYQRPYHREPESAIPAPDEADAQEVLPLADVDLVERPASRGGRTARDDEAERTFGEFWAVYPNKQGKQVALAKWRRLAPEERRRAVEVARLVREAVDKGWRERDKVPHGATFVSQRRWEDWADGPPPGYGPPPGWSRKGDDGPVVCHVCKVVLTPEDRLEAVWDEGRGWRHPVCRPAPRASDEARRLAEALKVSHIGHIGDERDEDWPKRRRA